MGVSILKFISGHRLTQTKPGPKADCNIGQYSLPGITSPLHPNTLNSVLSKALFVFVTKITRALTYVAYISAYKI